MDNFEQAFEQIYSTYYRHVYSFLYKLCHDARVAEDLTQETFYRLFRNISGYKSKKKFKAYLYTIANRLCIDESRKTPLCPLEGEENIINECDEILQLEDKEEITYLLNKLSPEQREATILRFGEQLSFDEIAKVMGCNMRTAQSRVRSGLKIMRKEQRNGKKKFGE